MMGTHRDCASCGGAGSLPDEELRLAKLEGDALARGLKQKQAECLELSRQLEITQASSAQRLDALNHCEEDYRSLRASFDRSQELLASARAQAEQHLQGRLRAEALLNGPGLLEQLAALEHERWSGWMRYLFTRGERDASGAFRIPAEWVERWQGQCDTPYAALTEREKESDRAEVRKTLAAIHAHVRGGA